MAEMDLAVQKLPEIIYHMRLSKKFFEAAFGFKPFTLERSTLIWIICEGKRSISEKGLQLKDDGVVLKLIPKFTITDQGR